MLPNSDFWSDFWDFPGLMPRAVSKITRWAVFLSGTAVLFVGSLIMVTSRGSARAFLLGIAGLMVGAWSSQIGLWLFNPRRCFVIACVPLIAFGQNPKEYRPVGQAFSNAAAK